MRRRLIGYCVYHENHGSIAFRKSRIDAERAMQRMVERSAGAADWLSVLPLYAWADGSKQIRKADRTN